MWDCALEPARVAQGGEGHSEEGGDGFEADGQLYARTEVDGQAWMDKRAVTMLSTIHDDSFVTKKRRSRTAQDGQEDILKPLMVKEYNKNMGGVDTGDHITDSLTVLSSGGDGPH